MRLEGRTAVVTGGSRGIGRAICVELAKEGAAIVTCYTRGAEAAEETVKLCKEYGVEAFAIQADVSDGDSVAAFIEAAKEKLGKIDILVNNAGITKDNLMLKMTEEDFDQVIDTNLKGAFLCIKNVTKIMMKQRYGRIINISSVVGVSGNAGQVNYAASKAGLIGVTKSVAKELASRNITANAVAPGFIESDMTNMLSDDIKEMMIKSIPLKRAGKPEDVAKLVSFLASEDAGYITGQVINCDGGMLM